MRSSKKEKKKKKVTRMKGHLLRRKGKGLQLHGFHRLVRIMGCLYQIIQATDSLQPYDVFMSEDHVPLLLLF
jgi:hypothetical protein